MTHSIDFNLNRRSWLTRSSATLAASLGVGSLANLALQGAASAADAEAGYRALVCIFLDGGNDGANTFVPIDARHTEYSNVRKQLALPKANLLSLTGAPYGLHPSLAPLMAHWKRGAMAGMLNVGPLKEPLTKSAFLAAPTGSPLLPESLYSHYHQKLLWDTATTTTQTTSGWGGRAADALNTVKPVIAMGGTNRFGVSRERQPMSFPMPGQGFGPYGMMPNELQWSAQGSRRAAMDALYAQKQTYALRTAFAKVQAEAFSVSADLSEIVSAMPGQPGSNAAVDKAFAPCTQGGRVVGELAVQLYQIAKLVANRAKVGGARQIYFANLNHFDTHGAQISGSPTQGAHADLLTQLGVALNCFHTAMQNLGLDGSVTSFTQSDFGRTLLANASNGSDHGWGNHQFMIGGAVNGGKMYGRQPSFALGGPDDVGNTPAQNQGRWIPTTSVDQYAATLLRWMGMDDAQLNSVLPNLPNFAQRNLGFMKA